MITNLDELAPAAGAVAQACLRAAVAGLDLDLRTAVSDELTAFLCERLSATAGVEDVRAAIAAAGPVAAASEPSWWGHLRDRLTVGVNPAGLDARIATTWWNPADERLLLPRAVGWGWDLNFGALAVRLGVIEPDAEAEPFDSTPETAFLAAAAVPVTLGAAIGLHYAVRGSGLPESLPAHWDIAGVPDRWTPKGRAAATDLAGTVLPAAAAVWAAAGSRRPNPNRAGAIAGMTALATASAAVAVWRSLGERPRPLAGPLLALAVAASAGGTLFGLARAGRAAEINRDLSRTESNEH